jgi:hypothetical protein
MRELHVNFKGMNTSNFQPDFLFDPFIFSLDILVCFFCFDLPFPTVGSVLKSGSPGRMLIDWFRSGLLGKAADFFLFPDFGRFYWIAWLLDRFFYLVLPTLLHRSRICSTLYTGLSRFVRLLSGWHPLLETLGIAAFDRFIPLRRLRRLLSALIRISLLRTAALFAMLFTIALLVLVV